MRTPQEVRNAMIQVIHENFPWVTLKDDFVDSLVESLLFCTIGYCNNTEHLPKAAKVPQARLTWTPEDAMADALAKHPDCTYADWANGLSFNLLPTIVVKLWSDESSYLNNEPPKHIEEGYLR